MKNIIYKLLSISFSITLLVGCGEFEDEKLDFSNSMPQYVELSSGSDITSMEGETVSVTVQIREAQATDITVSYSLTGDITSTGTVVIPKRTVSAAISVAIPNNTTLGTGGDAVLTLTGVDNDLTVGRGGPEAGFSAVSRKITWTEDKKEISFEVDTVSVSEAGVGTLRFIVNSSNPVDDDISVNYTISGDLTAGADYTLNSANPVVIKKGTARDTIEVVMDPSFDNAVKDGERKFYIELTSISGNNDETSLKADQALGRVFEDDVRTVAFSGTTTEISGRKVVSIPVTLTDLGFDHATSTSVDYSIAGGLPGIDYNDLSGGSILFVDETEVKIQIELLDNNVDDTFTITLDDTDDPEGEIDPAKSTFTIEVKNAPSAE